MLATFVIGLREGLEAALIVGIIATFLRTNGRRMLPMWLGVIAAVLLAIAVGVVLKVIETSLPQAAQEGMESIIGAVAIVFVTGMVLWMATHARHMKRELESSARSALGDGTSRALVVMAFLAVLKEGFETAVFLLATFQAAGNATLAATGAVLGILVAVGVGAGIYRGGVRINLARFFRFTSAFLILVAAGLVVTSLRTAHEAGWLNAGQQRVADLSWLAPNGSVQGALITGVLGIPADPRLVEVVGWLAYLVPMAILLLWPQQHRLTPRAGLSVRWGAAALLLIGAVTMALVIRPATLHAPAAAPLTGSAGDSATVEGGDLVVTDAAGSTRIPLGQGTTADHDGITTAEHHTITPAVPAGLPATLTLTELFALNQNRLPVGVSASSNPGPFTADWQSTGAIDVWVAEGTLLDASSQQALVVTLTGGGLTTPRTVTVHAGTALPGGAVTPSSWQVEQDYPATVRSALADRDASHTERAFWGRVVPLIMVATAVLVALVALRVRRRITSINDEAAAPSASAAPPAHHPGTEPRDQRHHEQRSTTHVS